MKPGPTVPWTTFRQRNSLPSTKQHRPLLSFRSLFELDFARTVLARLKGQVNLGSHLWQMFSEEVGSAPIQLLSSKMDVQPYGDGGLRDQVVPPPAFAFSSASPIARGVNSYLLCMSASSHSLRTFGFLDEALHTDLPKNRNYSFDRSP